ncbi:MAG: enolase C-terminal domain-like protein [Thalassobaculaceae bacterium]|nr:enolase C-terminal domain-like protein [Thalassobaculaceae bacterium]
MRILDITEKTVAISRYADPALPPGGLTTSVVAITTDARRDGRPVTGYGFASFGRFGQGGLIRERFAPRLLAAPGADLCDPDGSFDPRRAWSVIMTGEKPGGHGERCVAVGTLDMALWDIAAKLSGEPLYRTMARRFGEPSPPSGRIEVYAGGGYPYPADDHARLRDEMQRFRDAGYTRAKIKIAAGDLSTDLKRIDVAASALGGADRIAVDAMNRYDRTACLRVGEAIEPLGLWWFEDICDPLDLDLQAEVAAGYGPPIAAGEALFSLAEAKLLARHGGLRPGRDILLFDPVHTYGVPEFHRIVSYFDAAGWPRRCFWPHGGHLFALHVVAAFGLGGGEVNPGSFQPFGGLADAMAPENGAVSLPEAPGIGIEGKAELWNLIRRTFD